MSSSKPAWRRRIGRVSVYQRGERHWIYYRQGKQFRYPVGTDREEALALGAEVNAQLAEGAPTLLSFHPIDLDVLIRKWLDHHEQIRRSSLATAQRYRTAVAHLARYVESARGKLRADRLDASLAEAFVRYLRTTPVSPNGHKNTEKRTMRDQGVVFVLESCRALFNFARDQRHLPAYSPNPFAGLSIDRMRIEDAKPIRPLTAEQEIEFFKACDDWQFRVFFLLAFTGLRVGELTHLLIDNDVRLEENLIRVTNKPGLFRQVKTRNLRDVPLLQEVVQVLRTCIQDRRSGLVILRRRFADDPMLQQRGIQGVRVLVGLLSLANQHSAESIEQACQTARTHGSYRLRAVRALLDRQADQQEQFEFTQEDPIIRSPGEYEDLVKTAFAKEP